MIKVRGLKSASLTYRSMDRQRVETKKSKLFCFGKVATNSIYCTEVKKLEVGLHFTAVSR